MRPIHRPIPVLLLVALFALGAQGPCDPASGPDDVTGAYEGTWTTDGTDPCAIEIDLLQGSGAFFDGTVTADLSCLNLPGWPEAFPGSDGPVDLTCFGELESDGAYVLEGTYPPGGPPELVIGVRGLATDENADGLADRLDGDWDLGLAGPYYGAGTLRLDRLD